jgi:hypothetical protein
VSDNWTDIIHGYLNGVQKCLDLPLDVIASAPPGDDVGLATAIVPEVSVVVN